MGLVPLPSAVRVATRNEGQGCSSSFVCCCCCCGNCHVDQKIREGSAGMDRNQQRGSIVDHNVVQIGLHIGPSAIVQEGFVVGVVFPFIDVDCVVVAILFSVYRKKMVSHRSGNGNGAWWYSPIDTNRRPLWFVVVFSLCWRTVFLVVVHRQEHPRQQSVSGREICHTVDVFRKGILDEPGRSIGLEKFLAGNHARVTAGNGQFFKEGRVATAIAVAAFLLFVVVVWHTSRGGRTKNSPCGGGGGGGCSDGGSRQKTLFVPWF